MRLKKVLILLITFLFLMVGIIIVVLVKKIDLKLNEKPITFESRIKNIKEYKVGANEILGWIQVEGTNIDYPVTHSKYIADATPEEDLNHTWESGIFVEGENRRVIFGHNLQNVSSKPKIADPNHARFEQLMSYVDYKFASNHQYMQFTIDGHDDVYKIFAVGFYYIYQETGTSYDKEKMKSYIYKTRLNSIYDYDIDVNENDEVISLITCTRYFGIDGPTQFRVDARKIRENEKLEKYRVEKNENYDIIK